jgi:large subunit ribosomal protein L17
MYKRNSIKKLGRTSSHRKSLKRNLLRSILKSGKVETSSVKAKVLKGDLESLFSKVKSKKDGDLSLIRDLYIILGSKELVEKVFELSKKKTLKISLKKSGYRKGDNTQLSIVEIVGFKGKTKEEKKTTAKQKKEVETEQEEKKLPEEVQKGILNLGRKTVSKKVDTVRKERAKSRSGL